MKKTLIAAVLCGLILTALAGCAEQNAPADPTPSSAVTADVPSDTKSSDDISAEPAAPTESSAAGTSTPETQLPTEKEEGQPESTSPPNVQPEAPKPSETKPAQTKPPKENKPAPTEPTQPPKTEAPKPAPTEPPATNKPKLTEPQKPVYTQADYDRIIRETKAYAESYRSKGFTFEWKDSMEFGWDVGYMGTPRIEAEGVNGTIGRLKTHIDKIVETGTNPAYGIPSDSVTYKVVQITIDGDIAFAVIYGG